MSTTHRVKMAKASQKDIDGAIELYQFLQAMNSGRSCPEVVDEFGYNGYEDLLEREATDVEFALRAHERGGLFRVAWGLQVLLDPANEVVDPNLPHLELHPKHEQAAKERDAAQERVDLDVDEFRRIKAELDNLRVGLPPLTEDSARSLYAVVAGICERAVTAGRQRVPLIVQRDKAVAELAYVKRQRDELLEAAKLAIREIRPSTDCSMCHDSTWDHECDSKVNTTHVALSNAIKGALASEQMQPPKPVAWPHLPEVDRPDSEVQP